MWSLSSLLLSLPLSSRGVGDSVGAVAVVVVVVVVGCCKHIPKERKIETTWHVSFRSGELSVERQGPGPTIQRV